MLELLSLTSDNDLVLAKIDNYYLCLAEPSKRINGVNWYKAMSCCQLLGKDYYLPTLEELNTIYTNKGNLSLVEACLYSNEVNTIDFISRTFEYIDPVTLKYYPWIWSSDFREGEYVRGLFLSNGAMTLGWRNDPSYWALPVKRIEC